MACPNRLTIRIKVAEPQILAKLQEELLKPGTLDYITSAVQKEVKRVSAAKPKDVGALRKQLEQEKRKLQNLVSALEGGASAPGAILKAVGDRERPSRTSRVRFAPRLNRSLRRSSRSPRTGSRGSLPTSPAF